jgi:hypothetical protein
MEGASRLGILAKSSENHFTPKTTPFTDFLLCVKYISFWGKKKKKKKAFFLLFKPLVGFFVVFS